MAKQRDQEPAQEPREPERKLSALDRTILQAMGEQATFGREDDPARLKYPNVWEWLSQTEAGRDYVMQPAVITIQLGPEGVLATITHRDLKRSVGVACLELDQVFATLQTALASPNCPMRSWGKDPEPRLRKRRPKS